MSTDDKRESWGIPRRSCLDKLTPTEALIRNAEVAVEALTADVRLTHAGLRLQEARALVADFVDGVPFGEGYPRAAGIRVDPSHMPTIVDLLEDEVAALRKFKATVTELSAYGHFERGHGEEPDEPAAIEHLKTRVRVLLGSTDYDDVLEVASLDAAAAELPGTGERG